MTAITLNRFFGEVPAVAPHLLPDSNSQYAENCDFSSPGELRPLKGGTLVKTMTTTVKSLYTEDGTNFFTWPYEVRAVKGPVIGDVYNRVYYTTDGIGGQISVAQLSTATTTGGTPSSAWSVGVPAPTAAPVLTVVPRTTMRNYTMTYSATAWWEDNGTRYNEAAVTLTTITALQQYSFTPPSASGAPTTAKLVCNFVMTDASAGVIESVDVMAGADSPTSSSTFPGGTEYRLSSSGVLTITWGPYEYRAYVYTCVNQFDEEGAPSPAADIQVRYIDDVQAIMSAPSFIGRKPFSRYNLYRTSGTTTTYLKVFESGVGTVTDQSYRAVELLSPLASEEWWEPVANLKGLLSLPNGSLAAFTGNVVYFSEPYRPHAWPYSITFPKNVVGMRLAAQAMVVTTDDGCYNVLVTHPKNAQPQKLPTPQSGLANRSMSDVEGGAVFMSNDGLVMVAGSQASLTMSQQIFSREDWRTLYGAYFTDMWMGYHDGQLIGASSTAAKGFVIRLDEAGAGSFTRFPVQVDCLFRLQINDSLYYGSGTGVYSFKTGSNLTAKWRSKDFVLGKYVNFGAFYIRCTGSVTVNIYADGALWTTFTMTGTGYRRLPSGQKNLRWSIELQTAATVQEVVMAESMGELRGV